MKSGWFIMKLWKTSANGPYNMDKVTGQEKDGYKTKVEATLLMPKLCDETSFYTFTVMELWWN